MPTYTSQYPTLDTTHVKATTILTTDYYAHYATDPGTSLTGDNAPACSWICENGIYTNQRFHIDLGSEKVIRRIYYENMHNIGTVTDRGVYNFTFWGSNTEASFLELTYGTDTGWTELTVSQNTFDEHVGLDQADPKYITVTNSTEYRYYAFKFADNRSGANWMGVRRIELQTEDGWSLVNSIFFGCNF